MEQYFYELPIILMTLLCMIYLTVTNKYILSAQKKGFLIAFLGEVFIIVCEYTTVILDGSDVKFRFLHIIANYFGFLLTPVILLIFASSIGRFHRLKYAVISSAVYFIVFTVLSALNQVFYVDSQNNYSRGKLFWIYVVFYFFATICLLYETLRYSQKGFFRHKVFAILLSVCFLASASIQIFNTQVHTMRVTAVFIFCIYYAYCIELANLFDMFTGVLSQGTYLKKVEKLKANQTLIIMDVDRLKYINDNFGHLAGDKTLIIVSKALKSVFNNHGHCFRIGGDEFAVILGDNADAKNLILRFEKDIEDRSKNLEFGVSVSVGYYKYLEGDLVENVIRCADENMYAEKNRKKSIIHN